jgi:uncharacterized damage-inducible protein DinB
VEAASRHLELGHAGAIDVATGESRIVMTASELVELLDYNYWARDRLIEAVARLTPEQYTRHLGSSFPSVKETLSHVFFAEWIWCARWHGTSPPAGRSASEYESVAALAAAWQEVEQEVRRFAGRLADPDLDRVVEYRLLNRAPGASTISQIGRHVVNHGTYHRGQITTMLRQLGATPPSSLDLIAFYRERAR